MTVKITNTLARLPQDVIIRRIVPHSNCNVLYVESVPGLRICPKCDSHKCVINDSGRQQTARHIAVSRIQKSISFGIPEKLPETLCIDMFHVISRLNGAVDEARRRLRNESRESAPETYKLLKHTACLQDAAYISHNKPHGLNSNPL